MEPQIGSVTAVNPDTMNPASQFDADNSADLFFWISAYRLDEVLIYSIVISLLILTIIIYVHFSSIRDLKNRSLDEIAISAYADVERESTIKYYEYLRDEIRREDEIINQRLTWTLAFHAFLITSIGVLLAFSEQTAPDIVRFAKTVAVLLICLMGILFGLISTVGVAASRHSIEESKLRFDARNDVWNLYPHYVPQAYGQGVAFSWGGLYALFIPVFFVLIWSGVTLIYIYMAHEANGVRFMGEL